MSVTSPVRARAVQQATLLTWLTIGWNAVEAVAALTSGVAAASISLVAFGADSVIEVSSALVLVWRLRAERRDGCTLPDDRRATRLVAISLGALGAAVVAAAALDLATATRPETSVIGIVIAGLSLLVMPLLARAKRRVAPALGSRALVADATQTDLCTLLSGVLLVGLAANAALGWWWADPVAGLAIGGLAMVEARRTWSAESLADTCC